MKTANDPDPMIRTLLDYCAAASSISRGKFDASIVYQVAAQWAERGYCVIRTNTLARELGTHRKTVCRAIERLRVDGAIREIGRTSDGRLKFAPNLELATEWRARRGGYVNAA